jgi:hypothetical protein
MRYLQILPHLIILVALICRQYYRWREMKARRASREADREQARINDAPTRFRAYGANRSAYYDEIIKAHCAAFLAANCVARGEFFSIEEVPA